MPKQIRPKSAISGSDWFNRFKGLLNCELAIDQDYWSEINQNLENHDNNCILCMQPKPTS